MVSVEACRYAIDSILDQGCATGVDMMHTSLLVMLQYCNVATLQEKRTVLRIEQGASLGDGG